MTGIGAYNSNEDTFSLDVNVTGLAEGSLHYSRQSDGSIRVTGTYGDQTIDLQDTGK